MLALDRGTRREGLKRDAGQPRWMAVKILKNSKMESTFEYLAHSKVVSGTNSYVFVVFNFFTKVDFLVVIGSNALSIFEDQFTLSHDERSHADHHELVGRTAHDGSGNGTWWRMSNAPTFDITKKKTLRSLEEFDGQAYFATDYRVDDEELLSPLRDNSCCSVSFMSASWPENLREEPVLLFVDGHSSRYDLNWPDHRKG